MDDDRGRPPQQNGIDTIEMGLFADTSEYFDHNSNEPAPEDDLGLSNLFADLPSNLDHTRSYQSASRRSLRRRGSRTPNVDDGRSKSLVRSDVAGIIDMEDGLHEDELRSIPAPMAQRKSVRRMNQTLKQSEKERQKSLSCWKFFKLRVAMGWYRFKSNLKEFLKVLELWRSPLKEVEGHFGNGVLSYFIFLKSLILLNLVIFFLVFGFIVVPQVVINYGELVQNITQNYIVTVDSTTANFTCPNEDKDFYKNRTLSNNILDFFTGEGYINTTLMFYSNYQGDIYTSVSNNDITYNMELAYICVGGAYLIISLIMMVKNLAQGFTESIVETGGFFYSYCNKVFAGWDYCITDSKAAFLKCKSIAKDFKAELSEEKRLERIKGRTQFDKLKIYSFRMLVTIIVLGLLAVSIFAIIKAVEVSSNPELSRETNSVLVILKRWASSLTISALNVCLPFIFEILTSLEDWSPRVEVALTLWRAVLLKLASVAVLVITLFTSYSEHDCHICWENQVGSQMFNLILIDFFVSVGITIFGETGRKYIYRYLGCGCNLGEKIGMQEFQIPKNVLELVYGQSLIWIGTFFAPLIPVVGIIKLFILFYVKKISLMLNCKPSSQPYQGARSNYFFTLLLLLTFLLCSFAVGWGLTRIKTSCCGPFKNVGCVADYEMMDVVGRTIDSWPSWIGGIIDFIKTTAFIFPMFIIIFLLLYYYYAMTKAHEKMIHMLKDQLIMEGRDKRFLMDRLIRASEAKKSNLSQ
ncbi:transmembrane channel-like protein 7 isoform X1 [Clytia hemisphaerica]|uniref:TMC domain-containing protein n=3 Tax=Clytia hemisphaerica TaxID=252671 RepID=A0A7M5U9Y5_9CNID|eukprot:TCONS_00045748-protein